MKKDYTHVQGFHKGDLVKCVMVSRLGDCGLTNDMKAEYGYGLRLLPHELEPLGPIPKDVCPKCFYEKEAHEGGRCPILLPEPVFPEET